MNLYVDGYEGFKKIKQKNSNNICEDKEEYDS
jgi:hypothetical protein